MNSTTKNCDNCIIIKERDNLIKKIIEHKKALQLLLLMIEMNIPTNEYVIKKN